jgi:hypothetical protein
MRPESHVTGDVGQKAVALLLAEWGWTADVIQSDYGEDLNCHVFIEHHRTPLHFRCQVKSSVDVCNKVRRLKSGDFSVPIASGACRDWLLAYYPVLLVVYDRESKTAYWADATEQIRGKISSLYRKETTLHVSHDRVLANEEAEVVSSLTLFYSRLLKVHSEAVERTVFPVLMPGYRVVPSGETYDLFRLGADRADRRAYVHRNVLPAWTTSLRTLDGQFFSGMSFRVPSADLARFTDSLTAELSGAALPVATGEWLAFVCSPLRFIIQKSEEASDSLGRELTGWRSYAKIGSSLVADHEYAFAPPSGLIRQIGRRARSWDSYYFASREFDVAVQLLAAVATTPADRLFKTTLREHMLGQFLPWQCRRSELEGLQQRLWGVELVFAPLESANHGTNDSALISGAISTPMFAPAIGLIPQARNWAELEQGSVRRRIQEAEAVGPLPGREGPPELKDSLLKLVSPLATEVPEGWLVDGITPEPGLPIDLSMRRVIVERFRADPDFDPKQADLLLRESVTALADLVPDPNSIEAHAYMIESFESVAALSISWSPHLNESSAMSVERALPQIVRLFDKVLPRTNPTAGHLATSLDVLRFAGELYFEGDQMY